MESGGIKSGRDREHVECLGVGARRRGREPFEKRKNLHDSLGDIDPYTTAQKQPKRGDTCQVLNSKVVLSASIGQEEGESIGTCIGNSQSSWLARRLTVFVKEWATIVIRLF